MNRSQKCMFVSLKAEVGNEIRPKWINIQCNPAIVNPPLEHKNHCPYSYSHVSNNENLNIGHKFDQSLEMHCMTCTQRRVKRMDGWMEGRTNPLIEIRGRIL